MRSFLICFRHESLAIVRTIDYCAMMAHLTAGFADYRGVVVEIPSPVVTEMLRPLLEADNPRYPTPQ